MGQLPHAVQPLLTIVLMLTGSAHCTTFHLYPASTNLWLLRTWGDHLPAHLGLSRCILSYERATHKFSFKITVQIYPEQMQCWNSWSLSVFLVLNLCWTWQQQLSGVISHTASKCVSFRTTDAQATSEPPFISLHKHAHTHISCHVQRMAQLQFWDSR